MLPYVSRARVVRRRTVLQKLWSYKLNAAFVLAVLGYVAFLNYQLNAELRRTAAMEKQLQELTLQRLRDADAETNGSPPPVALQDNRPADVAAAALRGRAGGHDTGGIPDSSALPLDGQGLAASSDDAMASGQDSGNNSNRRPSSDNTDARRQQREAQGLSLTEAEAAVLK
jgi:hypothetical protein